VIEGEWLVDRHAKYAVAAVRFRLDKSVKDVMIAKPMEHDIEYAILPGQLYNIGRRTFRAHRFHPGPDLVPLTANHFMNEVSGFFANIMMQLN
jgi:hypothetical protein